MKSDGLRIKSANTILYCTRWPETVAFYQHRLGLPITFTSDWFVEFQLGGGAHLSVANEARASVNSSHGAGITITLRVENADEAWHYLQRQGVAIGPLKRHAWGARLFYFFDPEGHRLEIWSPE